MRNVVNISNGDKIFPFLIESSENRNYMVANEYHLVDVIQTSQEISEDTLVITDTPINKYGPDNSVNLFYRKINNWGTSFFRIQTNGTDIPEDRLATQEEIDIVQSTYGDSISNILKRTIHEGTKVIIDGMKFTNKYGELFRLQRYYPDPDFPQMTNRRSVRLIVPDFAPHVYTPGTRYVVDIVTRIGIKKLVLASRVFTTDDLLTLPKPFQDAGFGYHQYIDIDILDPWDICYNDGYYRFRDTYCYESTMTNNCGAILDIDIGVVVDDTENPGWYIPSVEYASGRNLLLLSERDSDYMSLNLSVDKFSTPMLFNTALVFNSAFDGNVTDYFRETYFMDIDRAVYEIVVMDDSNIYKMDNCEFSTDIPSAVDFLSTKLRFDSFSEYIEGMYITATLKVFSTSQDENMALRSNSIPLNKELFSYLVGEEMYIADIDTTIPENEEQDPDFVMNIEVTNIDAVNKIVKQVVNVSRPDDYKSNIIKPVFYHAYDTENIELHSGVTFNIGVDLDNYKSKVDTFSIQIEGMSFQEVGRVPGYVLFTIPGMKLPKANPSGTYYILDNKGIMVTKGKYEYTD